MKRRDFVRGAAAAAALPGLVSDRAWAIAGGDDYELVRPTAATDIPSGCLLCGVGCGLRLQTAAGRVTGIVPDRLHPVNEGFVCLRGETAAESIYTNRLTTPMIRQDASDPLRGRVSPSKGRPGALRRATWAEAESLIASRIGDLVRRRGSRAVGSLGSGQLPLEVQWVQALLMKGVLGSDHLEGGTRLTDASAASAYTATMGSDGSPACYDDIGKADLVVLWGHNPRSSHPVLFWRLLDRKVSDGVATLVVDPRRTGTVASLEGVDPDRSLHLGGAGHDIALLNGMAHAILQRHPDAVDEDFLRRYTTGRQDYVAVVLADYAPEVVAPAAGVPADDLYRAAAMWAQASLRARRRGSGGVLALWGNGVNQRLQGHGTAVSLVNLLALTGNVGRKGCGPLAMAVDANGIGERLAGCLGGRLPFDGDLADAEDRARTAAAWRVPLERLEQAAAAPNEGLVVGMLERAGAGDLDALFLVGASHVDLPDIDHLVRPALTRAFTVVHGLYADSPDHLYADVVLPQASWAEWGGGVFVQSERRMYVVDGTANPIRGCRPDLDILIDRGRRLAALTGLDPDAVFPYRRTGTGMYDPEAVFADVVRASEGTAADITGLARVAADSGLSLYEQLRLQRGIHWPAPTAAIARKGGLSRRYLGQEYGWMTRPYGPLPSADGRLHIQPWQQLSPEAAGGELPDREYAGLALGACPQDKYPFHLSTGSVYEHFGTARTVRAPTTKGLVGEMYVEIHPQDLADLGIDDGQWVRVVTRRGSFRARASVGVGSVVRPARNTVPRGFLFSPVSLSLAGGDSPEVGDPLVHRATRRAFDPVSGQVDFKACAARIEAG